VVKIYVEGGGDAKSLKIRCREGFRTFFEKAGLKGKMPRVVPCGSRNDAFDSFCTAIKNKQAALLLVDSEDAVSEEHQTGEPEEWKPWGHLKARDNWDQPDGSDDLDAHLMVVCMEAWLLADRDTLKKFFGQSFRENSLPKRERLTESIPKTELYNSLAKATKDCQKGPYGKGNHSFDILSEIDANTVLNRSPWAKRLVENLNR